jgi:flagellar M-ring protein FliF
MDNMKTWWIVLPSRVKAGLVAGALSILLVMVVAGWWVLRREEAVLFSDLKSQDAALMAAELDKLKLPYSVAENGTTLLVDKAQVHATRLKLMGRDLPLHGAVGLELFNNADFGMTEFAQKINYQRALQGELTRTILSFPEVRDARVHLALPEQGLFRQSSVRPTAAITLSLRPGRVLRGEQVNGMQRLVAAAVPGLSVQEVTVVDGDGVALSRSAADEGAASAGGRLDLKRDTENYLSRKADAVLERAFGPGQALASVDVTLNMDQVRVTTEDVIPAPDSRGGVATGVLVRERESARDGAPEGRGQDTPAARGSSMQRDVEYQTGRRVEQVVSQPGSIRRIQVVAVVRQPLDAEQQEQVRRLVAGAVGASPDRGDTVLVQAFRPGPAAVPPASPAPAAAATPAPAAAAEDVQATAPATLGILALALLILACALRRSRTQSRHAPRPVTPLTASQRQVALRRVEAWLHDADEAPPMQAGQLPSAGAPR